MITNNRVGRNIEIPRILAPTRTRKRKRTKEYSTSKKTVRTGIQTALTNYMLDSKKGREKINNGKEKQITPFSLPRPPEGTQG